MITSHDLAVMFANACEAGKNITGVDIRDQGYTWQYINHKKALGICNYRSKYVGISKHHLESYDRVYNTMLHEVAHAILPREGHSQKWQRLFKVMGGNGERCSAIPVENLDKVFKWCVINTLDNEIVARYCRKPTRDFSKCNVIGKPETLGKLKLVKLGV